MSKIQVILGSTRPGRVNTQVGKWVANLASNRPDLEVEIVDIADYNLPLLDEPMPPMYGQYTKEHTKKWAAKIAEADGFIFVAPEYNHSIPASLKNAIDYLYAEWNNKTVAFVSYGVQSGARSVAHLRAIAGQMNLADISEAVELNLATDFENYSVFKPGENQEAAAEKMLDQLSAWTAALKTVREPALV